MSTSNSASRSLALLAAVALCLVAGFAVWQLLVDHEPVPITAAGGADEVAATPMPQVHADDELATSPAGETRVTEAELAPPEAPRATESRTALGDALDGRRWRDFLVAVDDEDGEPVEGVRMLLVDGEGERRAINMDDVVFVSDLADGNLAALDADTVVPRVFFTSALREHLGPPRTISMHRSGALRCVLVSSDGTPITTGTGTSGSDAPPRHVSISLDMPLGGSEKLDTHLIVEGRTQAESIQPYLALGKLLRHMFEEESEARWRKRQARWLGRTEALHPAIALDGPPFLSAWATVDLDEKQAWPALVTELPAGAVVRLYSGGEAASDGVAARSVELRVAGGTAWSSDSTEALRVGIEAGATAVVEFRHVAQATVRGLLPERAISGDVHSNRMRGDSSWSWVTSSNSEADSDGAFVLNGLEPGSWTLHASWRESDGSYGMLDLPLDLASGEDRDVGRLVVPDGRTTLTITPRLIVNGRLEEDVGRSDFDGVAFDVILNRVRTLGAETEVLYSYNSTAATGLESLTLRGLEPAHYYLTLSEPIMPEALGERYAAGEWTYPQAVDLTSDASVEATLELTSAAVCTVALNLPAGTRTSYLDVSARAYSKSDGTEVDVSIEFESRLDGAKPHEVNGRAMLPPGEWTIAAVASPRWKSDNSTGLADRNGIVLQSFVGRSSVTVSSEAPAAVRVDLGLAAVVECAEVEGSSGNYVYLSLVPVGELSAVNGLWTAYGERGSGPLVIWGLFPDTEYRDASSDDLVVRTGGPGSVTRVSK